LLDLSGLNAEWRGLFSRLTRQCSGSDAFKASRAAVPQLLALDFEMESER
jgi:hypothetical protein